MLDEERKCPSNGLCVGNKAGMTLRGGRMPAGDQRGRAASTIPDVPSGQGLGARKFPLEREAETRSFSGWAVCLSLKRTALYQNLLGFCKAHTETRVAALPKGEKLS